MTPKCRSNVYERRNQCPANNTSSAKASRSSDQPNAVVSLGVAGALFWGVTIVRNTLPVSTEMMPGGRWYKLIEKQASCAFIRSGPVVSIRQASTPK